MLLRSRVCPVPAVCGVMGELGIQPVSGELEVPDEASVCGCLPAPYRQTDRQGAGPGRGEDLLSASRVLKFSAFIQ